MPLASLLLGHTGPNAVSAISENLRFIALDVETANGDRSSICQLGLALVDFQGGIQTASFLIDPRVRFSSFNIRLHGIGPDTVAGHPGFDTVLPPLRDLLQRHPLVQHSSFDKRAMDGACESCGLSPLDSTWHDSVRVARKAWPQLKGNGGHGLASLKGFLGLDFKHHDAAEDAKAAAQVILLAEAETGQDFNTLS